MAKFITGKALEEAICNIIWDAKEKLTIVSPFIKLDEYFIEIFKRQANSSRLHLLVIFGKNEQDKSRSLNQNDFEFFKSFPHVSIIYVPNLHAKYYGNESKGVITSINMYDHSFKNNIEFGVFSENNLMDKLLTQSSDQDAWNECQKIANNGEPVFIRRPVFKKKMLGVFGKDYVSSTTLLDNTDSFFNNGRSKDRKKLSDFPDEIDFGNQPAAMPAREDFSNKNQNNRRNTNPYTDGYVENSSSNSSNEGYCIRTGIQIPFNPGKPFCIDAYRNWAQFENWDYSENYCHRTGRKSYGKTSMRNPILN